jgi:hypothetical protein
MPLPRKKEDGSGGAPVLNILRAHVRLVDVEEYTEPFVVTRKSDGATFTLDPQFKCAVEIVDDTEDGSDNGAKFFESFKYKKAANVSYKNGKVVVDKDAPESWENKENSKLGMLTKVVKPKYFEDDTIPELTAEDLEGFEFICQVKPKRNPETGKVLGSTIDWESMKPLPQKAAASAATSAPTRVDTEFDDGFDDIPF